MINYQACNLFIFTICQSERWRVPDAPQSIVEAMLPLTYSRCLDLDYMKQFFNYVVSLHRVYYLWILRFNDTPMVVSGTLHHSPQLHLYNKSIARKVVYQYNCCFRNGPPLLSQRGQALLTIVLLLYWGLLLRSVYRRGTHEMRTLRFANIYFMSSTIFDLTKEMIPLYSSEDITEL